MRSKMMIIFCLQCISFGYCQNWEINIPSCLYSKNKDGNIILQDKDANGNYIILDSSFSVLERGIYKNGEKYFKYQYSNDSVIYYDVDSAFYSYGKYTLELIATNFNKADFMPMRLGYSEGDTSIFIEGFITKTNFSNIDSATIHKEILDKCNRNNYKVINYYLYPYEVPLTIHIENDLCIRDSSDTKIEYDKERIYMRITDGYSSDLSDFRAHFSAWDSTSIRKIEIVFENRKIKFIFDCKSSSFMNNKDEEICSCSHFNSSGQLLQNYKFVNGELTEYYLAEIGKTKKVRGSTSNEKLLPSVKGKHMPAFYEADNGNLVAVIVRPNGTSLYLLFKNPYKDDKIIWPKKIKEKYIIN